ncbi:MAG: sulfotransferase family protein [Flavobacteriales bacterium]
MIKVFILSSPRSGSTLLRLTLDKINGLTTLPETHFWVFKKANNNLNPSTEADRTMLADRWVSFYTIKKYPGNHEELKARIIHEARSWKDMLDFTVTWLLTLKAGKITDGNMVAEKSPPHIFYQDEIKKMYPDAKFIYIVRDPRDVVASLKTCNWSTSNVLINSRVWRNSIRKMRKGTDTLLVKYEELVTQPQAQLERICVFLGTTFNPEAISKSTSDDVESGSRSSKNALKPMNTGFIESFREKLSYVDKEREIIEHVCRKEMDMLGYKTYSFKKNWTFRKAYFVTRVGLFLSRI